MLNSTSTHSQTIFFIGQNSHGTCNPWVYRKQCIEKLCHTKKIAVAFECPTADLIFTQFSTIKNFSDKQLKDFLFSSVYWWMQSIDVLNLMRFLIGKIDCYGIDMPFIGNNDNEHLITKTLRINTPNFKIISNLIQDDINYLNNNLHQSGSLGYYLERELLMKMKIEKIMALNYDVLFVLCHNFHASKKTWLNYQSLCQYLLAEKKYSIVSYGVYSKYMSFIAAYETNKYKTYFLDRCIIKSDSDKFYVKNISAYYSGYKKDILSISISCPEYFDEIIVFDTDSAISLEWLNEKNH